MQHDVLNICVVDNLALKAGRDRVSGVLRYAAGLPHWHVRILSPNTNPSPTEFRGLTARQAGFAAVIGDEQELAGLFRDGWNPHRRVPNVVIDPFPRTSYRHCEHVIIEIDDEPLVKTAFQFHVRHGLRQLAYFGSNPRGGGLGDKVHAVQRAHILREQTEALGLHLAVYDDLPAQSWIDDIEHLARWLAALSHPCGVLAYNDAHAQMVVNACRLAHLRIPDQIQLIGIDNDISICENLQPTLTSIQPDFEGAGFLAAQKIDQMLQHGCLRTVELIRYGVKDIVERASTQDIKGGGRLVGLAREYMRLHAPEPITVTQIAQALNVCTRTLERRFNDVLHRGVAEVLRAYRLERACHLLRETDRTINDIAGDVGFDSPNHLKAAFKKAFGVTMREWRHRKNVVFTPPDASDTMCPLTGPSPERKDHR